MIVERSWLILGGVIVVLFILVGIRLLHYETSRGYTYNTNRNPTQTPSEVRTPTETIAPPVAVPDRIVIGFTLPSSGAFSKEGQLALKGALAAVKWVNEVYGGVKVGGKRVPIEVKYYDDESKRDLVISLYERLITVDKVHFLLGTYTSTLVMAVAPVAEKYGMVFVNWGGASDLINKQGYKYVVTTWTQASRYMAPVLDLISSLDPTAKRVALI